MEIGLARSAATRASLAAPRIAELLHPLRQLAQLDAETVGNPNQRGKGRIGDATLQLADPLERHLEVIG